MLAYNRWLQLAVVVLSLVGCGQRTPKAVSDAAVARDQPAPAPDWALAPDFRIADAAIPDRQVFPTDLAPSTDLGFCGVTCKPGEVYLISSCVATDKLFTCAPGCDPSDSTACAAWPNTRCEQWGGTPCCICAAVTPACVPEASPPTPIVGPLRIHPTSGTAGQKVTLSIQGAPFYIGALFYNIRMGQETTMEEGASKPCTIAATFTPSTPGIYAVEVSQYGGGGPWALAGFYTASGGAIFNSIQPGDFCNPNPAPGDLPCASAAPYTCTCVTGRCRCK